jgi:hypothetical protein
VGAERVSIEYSRVPAPTSPTRYQNHWVKSCCWPSTNQLFTPLELLGLMDNVEFPSVSVTSALATEAEARTPTHAKAQREDGPKFRDSLPMVADFIRFNELPFWF